MKQDTPPIEALLEGGDPRSLGNVNEIVTRVLDNPSDMAELFECLFSKDEIVRMRSSDALEKIARIRPDWFAPYVERLLQDAAQIRQPSVQWHLAQIVSSVPLSDAQTARAIRLLQYNLHTMNDWIVANFTLEALAVFARQGHLPKDELIQLLKAHQTSRYKSLVTRTNRLLKEFVKEAR